jgi:hypothetical protein
VLFFYQLFLSLVVNVGFKGEKGKILPEEIIRKFELNAYEVSVGHAYASVIYM